MCSYSVTHVEDENALSVTALKKDKISIVQCAIFSIRMWNLYFDGYRFMNLNLHEPTTLHTFVECYSQQDRFFPFFTYSPSIYYYERVRIFSG